MRYQRQFKLQAAHFNGDWCYNRVWASQGPQLADLSRLLTNIHGHNFKIKVTLEGPYMGSPQAWLVDDVELNKAVMAWDNTNLSMHPDFLGDKIRATTENMARTLFAKLLVQFGSVVKSVTVCETDEIYATAGG